jgi:hypothetical protein
VGEQGKDSRLGFPSREAGVGHFEWVFQDKTGNLWKNRHSFVRVPGRYHLVEPVNDAGKGPAQVVAPTSQVQAPTSLAQAVVKPTPAAASPGPVDPIFEDYDCILNMTNSQNNNLFVILQVRSALWRHTFYQRWGRVTAKLSL